MKGFQPRSFDLRGGFTIPPLPTFPQAPLSSRKVGFPESGWQQWHFPSEPSRPIRRLSVRPHTPLDLTVISPTRHILEVTVSRFCARTTFSIICPPFTESPFARSRRYPLRCDLMGHIRRHYPSVIATPNSCARPKSSPGLGLPLYQESLQVCDESLLEVGPSRRYLYESFSTCLDPYPGCSCGAFTRFFPQDFGLPSRLIRSALSLIHTIATSAWGNFRSCSHSLMFKPADLLATQIAPTAANISWLSSHGFYIRTSHGSLPPRAPDMLTVRFGQLTVRGLAPLKIRSLVGCS